MGATKSKSLDNPKTWNNSSCRKKKVLLLGLDGVGKTHLFTRLVRHYKSNAKNDVLSRPTLGYNVETIKVRNHPLYQCQTQQITLWDCGGDPCVRPLWSYHYPDTSLLLWMINAHDRSRLDTSLHHLSHVLTNPLLCHVPVLIVLDHSEFERDQDEQESIIDANLLTNLEVAFRFLATLSSSRASTFQWQVINMNANDDFKKIEHSFRHLMKF